MECVTFTFMRIAKMAASGYFSIISHKVERKDNTRYIQL